MLLITAVMTARKAKVRPLGAQLVDNTALISAVRALLQLRAGATRAIPAALPIQDNALIILNNSLVEFARSCYANQSGKVCEDSCLAAPTTSGYAEKNRDESAPYRLRSGSVIAINQPLSPP